MSDRRVLVVGTTPDYIAYIHEHYPGRALFLTDLVKRTGSSEAAPDEASEIICNLLDTGSVMRSLHKHLEKQHQSLSGVACYDCEWLGLSAKLAEHFELLFPSMESVKHSRDKFLTKSRWSEHGVRCPKVEMVYTRWQALRLIERFNRPVVLKPLTGTGSELTFLCRDNHDLATAYQAIKDGLIQRSQSPLYKLNPVGADKHFPDQPVLAEEFVEGREYSADFTVDDNNIVLIRIAKKLRSDNLPFGTTMAYVVPAKLPGLLSHVMLSERLRDAAKALGLTRAICMVDFIISHDEMFFLELTPRIGGDCLPPLIRKSSGLDTIGLALDFAEGRKCEIPPTHLWTEHVGMRLFSPSSGTLSNVNCKELSEDSRVKDIFIKHVPGHEIALPPEDYDSWLLGHIIFEPKTDVPLRTQCNDLREKIFIDVEQYHDKKLSWPHRESYGQAQPSGPAA